MRKERSRYVLHNRIENISAKRVVKMNRRDIIRESEVNRIPSMNTNVRAADPPTCALNVVRGDRAQRWRQLDALDSAKGFARGKEKCPPFASAIVKKHLVPKVERAGRNYAAETAVRNGMVIDKIRIGVADSTQSHSVCRDYTKALFVCALQYAFKQQFHSGLYSACSQMPQAVLGDARKRAQDGH